MKKVIFFLSIVFCSAFYLVAERYKIINVEYSVKGTGFNFLGTTKPSILKQKFPINKKKIFESAEELENYINNFKSSLESERAFDSIEVNYETSLADNSDAHYDETSESQINDVILKVDLVDSHHFVIVPYPKYSSDNGASLKLKMKDTNFLGTLNTMNSEINLKLNDDGFKPGLSFNFNYPFSIGEVDCTFVNDYSLVYVVADEDNSGFEWDTTTGLELSIPFEVLPLNIGFYQSTGANLGYKQYDDYWFFTERFSLGTSYTITEFPNFTTLSYDPSIGVTWNWDRNGIHKDNDGLASPVITFSHSLSNGKVTWNNNFRNGYSLSLGNTISYNFHKRDFNPSISFNANFFYNFKTNDQEYFNRYGICTMLYAFYYFEVPINNTTKQYDESFADKLRGVLSKDCASYPAAIVMSLDLPHNMFTTDFKNITFLNCNVQASPFFDMALVYNKEEKRLFNPYDGYYCAGLEFLVYPVRWSSITVRASLGVDLNKALNSCNFMEAISNYKEIDIGIGLQY